MLGNSWHALQSLNGKKEEEERKQKANKKAPKWLLVMESKCPPSRVPVEEDDNASCRADTEWVMRSERLSHLGDTQNLFLIGHPCAKARTQHPRSWVAFIKSSCPSSPWSCLVKANTWHQHVENFPTPRWQPIKWIGLEGRLACNIGACLFVILEATGERGGGGMAAKSASLTHLIYYTNWLLASFSCGSCEGTTNCASS